MYILSFYPFVYLFIFIFIIHVFIIFSGLIGLVEYYSVLYPVVYVFYCFALT